MNGTSGQKTGQNAPKLVEEEYKLRQETNSSRQITMEKNVRETPKSYKLAICLRVKMEKVIIIQYHI